MSLAEDVKKWLVEAETKIKAGLPAFEASVVQDLATAKSAVESYAGPFAASLVEVAKELNPTELQAFAEAVKPFIESKVLAGLAAINISGSAAVGIAQATTSAILASIVSAVAAIAVPK